MHDNIKYDEWIDYDIKVWYNKAKCSIQLFDGTIIDSCYPNAGKFAEMIDPHRSTPEERVAKVKYVHWS